MNESVVHGTSVTGGMLVVSTLLLVAVGWIGWARGYGVRPALWTGLVISVCLIAVVTLGTVVTGQFTGKPGLNLVPFEEIRRGLDNRGTSSWTNVVGNVALFIPLGFAIACLVRAGWWGRWIAAAISGLVMSATIEVTQYAFGRVADVDDIILNTGGAVAGGALGAIVSVVVIRARHARHHGSHRR